MLREKINTDNASFNATTMAVLMHLDINTFAKASAEVNVLVGKYFALTHKPKGRYSVSSVEVANFATSSVNGWHFYVGIDITDFMRYYP